MKKLAIGKRGQEAVASPIGKLIPFATAAKEKGRTIYHLNIGDPDFLLPDAIKEELQHIASTIDRLPYPPFRGETPLLDAWRLYYEQIGLPNITQQDLLVTSGASDALLLSLAAILDPDDEILVFEPFFAPYTIYAQFISNKLIPITLDKDNGYHLPSKEMIVSKITNKTKVILFTNPNNPTGTVFTRSELETIRDIAFEHNLFILSDETYRGMVFDNKESLSMLHVAKEKHLDTIIVADSVSKRLNVCGARMGVILSKNAEFMGAAFRFLQGRPYAALLEEKIITPMLRNSLPYIQNLTKQYQSRRDIFVTTLEEELAMEIPKPEGAFYAMVPLPIKDTDDFAKWLLTDFQENNETVMVSPGAGFYATEGKGKNEVRVAYVTNETSLQRAAQLLARGVKKYKERE